jgi:hypothetical protein
MCWATLGAYPLKPLGYSYPQRCPSLGTGGAPALPPRHPLTCWASRSNDEK